MKDVKVDIVIPIYNAFEFTKKCIETVIENTDLQVHTLVLVNDKSTDEKVLPMLQDFASKNAKLNIKIIDNKENQGFVKSVNIGMQNSSNDVVLLNSDTEVTGNWLSKMITAAYSSDIVATVTPLSNNATLASVPNFLEENDLPSYAGLEEYAKVVEACSYNAYPELTTAHGFCMYIRRDAIDKVGFFDDQTFEKGYGEENDFSYRCINSGLVNILCDNTFIYHKGTQSFTEDKEELAKSHWEILKEKYPNNVEMNNDLCIRNPYSYIQDNIKYTLANRYRKNMLIVVHEFDDLKEKMVGGTVQHIYDMIPTIRKNVNCHVFYFKEGNYYIKSFFENSTAEMVLGNVISYETARTHNLQYRKVLEKLFGVLNIDFAHIHHLGKHYFDLYDMLKEKEIPYFVSLHDFYFVCPSILLLENGEKFCADNENRNCKECLKKLNNIDGDFINTWRELTYKLLKDAKKIIAPTKSAKDIYSKFFKDLDITVIEHGMDKEAFTATESVNDTENRKKNIAFVGGMNPSKGLNFMKALIEKAKDDEFPYVIHFFGRASEWEVNFSSKNYVFHDMYDRQDIVKILKENNIDIVLLLAIWAETYSYTLTESAIAGIPVLALPYGAIEERVNKENLGWLLSKDATVEDVLQKLNSIFENDEEYKNVVASVKKYADSLKTVSAMANEYAKIYDGLSKKEVAVDSEKIKSILLNSKFVISQKEQIAELKGRIENYHYTVTDYKKEIDRLNEQVGALTTERALQDCELDRCHAIEREFIEYKNRLEGSRKMRLLRKIKFIDY